MGTITGSLKKLGLYIHFPFCSQKCRYCAFATFPNQENLIPRYVEVLKKEVDYYTPVLANRSLTSIYFGGGTPSLADPALVRSVLDYVKETVQLSKSVEITIEANPESTTEAKLSAWLEMGINRLSIGLQAWQNPVLAYLGRRYSHEDYEQVYAMARKVGFRNINVDVIFGIPIQTFKEWQETLEAITALRPEHIACYSLESDNESAFSSWKRAGIWKEKSEADDRKEYCLVREALCNAGYHHYEISNFSKPGKECGHNLSIWRGGEYLGLGASSVSFVEGVSFANPGSLTDYLVGAEQNRFGREDRETFNRQRLSSRQLILNLRMVEGFSLEELADNFGQECKLMSLPLKRLMSLGLLTLENDWLRLTDKGLDVVDRITAELV